MNAMYAKPAGGLPPQPPAQPQDSVAADWAGVLDCGAPGPGRQAPALFYQAGEPNQKPAAGAPGAAPAGQESANV